MGTFLFIVSYTNGSWARMIRRHDDRTAALTSLLETYGGSLERVAWDVESLTAYAVAGLHDAVTAAAVRTAVAQTGAFSSVEVHELLSQEQLSDVLVMARDGSNVYKAPGYADAVADS